MLCGSRRKPAKETRAPRKWDKKKGKQKQEVKDRTTVSIFSPNSGKMKWLWTLLKCAQGCFWEYVIFLMLLCGLWVVKIGASVIPRGVICAQTRLPSSSPSGIFGFGPFTYKSKAAPWSPVYFCCAPRSLFSGCAFYHLPFFFLPTHKSLAQTRTRLLVCALLFLRISLQASVSLRHSLARVCVGELEWLRRSRVLPGELARAAAALFVFHCCSNNGSPWAGSPPNWETAAREWDAVQSDRVAFYAGSISRASTLTSTISSIIHQAMLPG